MKFIDILVARLREELDQPARIREILISLCMELAVKSTTLPERKAWEIISLLISFVSKSGVFPDPTQILRIRSLVNSQHRESSYRTSDLMFTLKMFELGEHTLKEFLSKNAWDGMPGFGEQIPEGHFTFSEASKLEKATSRDKVKRDAFSLKKFLEWWDEVGMK